MDTFNAVWDFCIKVYSVFPYPFIAVVTLTVGMLFGSAIVQFIKVSRRASDRRNLTRDEMKLYSRFISCVVGGFLAYRFRPIQDDWFLLMLYSLGSGIFCPWVANWYIEKLNQYDPVSAKAVEQAFDGDTTIEMRKKCGPGSS